MDSLRGTLSRYRSRILPSVVALSLLGGVFVSLVESQGAQADYYDACGYGFNSSGTFGYGYGYGYGYGLSNNYGYGNGNQVCPTLSSSGGGSAFTPQVTPTTTPTTTGPTTTLKTNPPKGKKVPSLLGLRVYFANWSAVLTPHYKKVLDKLAHEIVADHTTHITITGYASVIGTPGINLPLSLLRAETVEAYLMADLKAMNYHSITFTVSGNGVLRAYANLALDRVVIITG